MYARKMAQQKTRKRRKIWIGVGGLVIVAAAIAVGVALALTKKKGSTSSGGGSGGSGGTGSSSSTSGKTGSKVTMEGGSTFVYTNDFGGDWAFDPKLPFAAGGQAQSWTPRVGQDDWVWGQDVVKGVNLG
jgi:glucan 1,3-beta-glucosidase